MYNEDDSLNVTWVPWRKERNHEWKKLSNMVTGM